MGLEDYISSAIQRVKASFSSDQKKWIDYLKRYELRQYFSEDLPEEERERRNSELEKLVSEKVNEYDGCLNGLLRKATSKGAMGVAIANDIYSFVSNTAPIYNVVYLRGALFGLKTLAEIPALYKYVKKSKDWYGAIKFLAMKPVRYLLPVIGEALEAGAFERMVRKGLMKDVKYAFVKKFGDYQSAKEVIHKKLSRRIKDAAVTFSGEEVLQPA